MADATQVLTSDFGGVEGRKGSFSSAGRFSYLVTANDRCLRIGRAVT